MAIVDGALPAMDLHLRPAALTDTAFLGALEEACMRGYAEALWGAWTPRPPGDLMLDQHRILVRDGVDVGCLAVKIRPDHLWLDKLYLAPAAQNGGLGSWMFAVARAEARTLGLPVRLNVLRNNPALRFYLRHGCHVIGRTDTKVIVTDAPA